MGALFIAGGTVNIERVCFMRNTAKGGTALDEESNHGKGGSTNSHHGLQGGAGGSLNITGEDAYYFTIGQAGQGGKGGSEAVTSGEGYGESGDRGTDGGFGCGGGQGVRRSGGKHR